MELLDDDPTIPVVHLDPTPKPRDKSLRTNHPCAICGVYEHYTIHCPDLPDYRAALYEMNNLDLEMAPLTIEVIHPPVSSPSGEDNPIYMISSATTPSSKWAEAMPTFNCTADTTARFFFNHVIT